ncbi:unnamed protein product [Parnassius mnemosyne]|uniref:Reverse transcriptase n=1 Tax=Parnassius mnemosyne TaxID=213953 RepID=A0AAV1LIF3_9NEOP
MLQASSIHCYADDSTGDALYTGRANISRENVAEYRNKLVSEVESLLSKVSDWGRLNLVQFNPQKTQVCAFTAKKNPFVVSPQFQDTSLLASAIIGILGVEISSDVQCRGHLEGKAKLASKKLGVLSRAGQYFMPAHRLQLYKAQVRPHMNIVPISGQGLPSASSFHLTASNAELRESSTTKPFPIGSIHWHCEEMLHPFAFSFASTMGSALRNCSD